MELAVKEIKRIRVECDKNFKVMQAMICIQPSREISIAITSLQNAKMWIGQVLKQINYLGAEPQRY